MSGDVGTDHGKQRVDGLAVERTEVHRMAQQAERDEWGSDVKQNRVPHVRNGDAVADRRRAESLARQ